MPGMTNTSMLHAYEKDCYWGVRAYHCYGHDSDMHTLEVSHLVTILTTRARLVEIRNEIDRYLMAEVADAVITLPAECRTDESVLAVEPSDADAAGNRIAEGEMERSRR